MSGRHRQREEREEREGGPGAGEQVAGPGALCPFPPLSPLRPEAEAGAREPLARGWGAAVWGVGVPRSGLNKGRVAPAGGGLEIGAEPRGPRFPGGLPFHSSPHFF